VENAMKMSPEPFPQMLRSGISTSSPKQ
jgi:hypothetical protein